MVTIGYCDESFLLLLLSFSKQTERNNHKILDEEKVELRSRSEDHTLSEQKKDERREDRYRTGFRKARIFTRISTTIILDFRIILLFGLFQKGASS